MPQDQQEEQVQQKIPARKEHVFPERLKWERAQRGWSQADVAKRIGSDPKTVGRWERGITFPSPYLCQQLSELYGKSLQELQLVRDEAPFAVQEKPASAQEEHPVLANAVPQAASRNVWRGRRLFFSLALLMAALLIVLLIIHIWAAVTTPDNPYARGSTLALNETLATNSATGWSLERNDQGQCFFADSAYRIRDVQNGFMEVCLGDETYFTNFTYEASMTIEAGDCGGLAFRSTFPQLYYFLSCRDGNYRFVRYDKDHAANIRIIAAGITPAIHQGFNTTNILAVVAIDDTFAIYVNHTLVVRGQDGAYLDGQIGMIAHTCRVVYADPRPNLCDSPTEVLFKNARVWKM